MADAPKDPPEEELDDNLGQALADAFASDEAEANPTAEPEKPADGDPAKPKEGDKADDPKDPKKEEPKTPPADPTKKPEDGTTPPEGAKKEGEEEEPAAPQPLTKDDVTSIIQNLRTEERSSGQELETATKEVMDAYYPDGLSNVLVDQASGKELKTPQDVVDASGGNMSIEEAAQWLTNEQFKLDRSIAEIKADAEKIAETTVQFKRGAEEVIRRYEPIFKKWPQLQDKVWGQYKKLIKADEAKGVILSAPDIREFYDTVLDPYRLAYEHETKNPGTNPTTPPDAPETQAAPPKPGQADRMDEGGDGGETTEVDDPNDFAQQVKKELAKGI